MLTQYARRKCLFDNEAICAARITEKSGVLSILPKREFFDSAKARSPLHWFPAFSGLLKPEA